MKFSIIIPTYNRAAFLPAAIESVLLQTHSNWELIVVDDGSTDNTREVVTAYTDSRINYVFQPNAERSAARNNGIAHATGDYVCFMDSDNEMLPTRLAGLQQALSSYPNPAAFYTDIIYRNPKTNVELLKEGIPFSFPINKDTLLRTVIATPQLCCSLEVLKKHQFNTQLSIGEDTELIARITDEYPLVYLPKQATIVEIDHANRSVSNRSASSEKQFKSLRVMFSKGHPANKVSCGVKRWCWSAVYFNASYDYLREGKRKGVVYLLKSILINPFQRTTLYKMNIAFNYILGRKQRLYELLS